MKALREFFIEGGGDWNMIDEIFREFYVDDEESSFFQRLRWTKKEKCMG